MKPGGVLFTQLILNLRIYKWIDFFVIFIRIVILIIYFCVRFFLNNPTYSYIYLYLIQIDVHTLFIYRNNFILRDR